VRSGGAQAAMADVAYPLSEEEIEALAHYIAHL
jgi:cytochrome c553